MQTWTPAERAIASPFRTPPSIRTSRVHRSPPPERGCPTSPRPSGWILRVPPTVRSRSVSVFCTISRLSSRWMPPLLNPPPPTPRGPRTHGITNWAYAGVISGRPRPGSVTFNPSSCLFAQDVAQNRVVAIMFVFMVIAADRLSKCTHIHYTRIFIAPFVMHNDSSFSLCVRACVRACVHACTSRTHANL